MKLTSLDRWTGGASVVSPTVDHHPGREFLADFLRDEMELLDSVFHHVRERRSVRGFYRCVADAIKRRGRT